MCGTQKCISMAPMCLLQPRVHADYPDIQCRRWWSLNCPKHESSSKHTYTPGNKYRMHCKSQMSRNIVILSGGSCLFSSAGQDHDTSSTWWNFFLLVSESPSQGDWKCWRSNWSYHLCLVKVRPLYYVSILYDGLIKSFSYPNNTKVMQNMLHQFNVYRSLRDQEIIGLPGITKSPNKPQSSNSELSFEPSWPFFKSERC